MDGDLSVRIFFTARRAAIISALSGLAACGPAPDPTDNAITIPTANALQPAVNAAIPPGAPLSARLDCLRETGAALVIAHRGGPTRDYPENALETLARTQAAGALGMEIDIAESADGVLFLMHDDDLERTSTGDGPISETSWSEIERLNLETYTTETGYHPPTLDSALAWAVRNNALVELDKKRSTSYDGIIDAVEANGAENNVLMITYTDEQAVELHARAPDLVITATVNSPSHLDELIRRGVKPENLIAWTGIERPDPELWRALAEKGVETAFGTLGRRGERLDDLYWEDRDGAEYDDLADGGATLIVTDYSDRVSRQLAPRQALAKACGF